MSTTPPPTHSSSRPPSLPPSLPPTSLGAAERTELAATTTLILRAATRFLLPVIALFAIVITFQGHNKPGGGFIGGLIAASGLALHALAFGPHATRRLILIDPRTILAIGLLTAVASALFALLLSDPLMSPQWTSLPLPGMDPLKLGTPMLFDVGVFLTVLSIGFIMVLALLRTPAGPLDNCPTTEHHP
jgi:multicomponent Na+:H+ antiporter subunit B